ncbi:MAG: sensor histidine kinase, partial [Verrucomicrobiota bacterium]
ESARQLRRVDGELQRRLPLLVAAQHPVRGEPGRREFILPGRDAAWFDGATGGDFYYVVWLRHGRTPVTRSPSAPEEIPEPRPGEPTTRQRGIWRECFLFPGPGDCVLVGRSIEPDLIGLRQLAWWLAGAGTGVLLLGLAGGAWVVARALRPIDEITAAAQRIAGGDLSRRIDTADAESELGRLAGVLNSTFARLEAAFTQQTRFTADAAHELRTPVAVILTHAQNALATPGANEEHREAFEAIERAARRMRRLLESLLQLARLDAGQEVLRCAPGDLARLAAEGIEIIRPLAARRGLRLHASLSPAICPGDPDRLAQVVTNLVSNAIDYNHEGGEVRVTTTGGPGTATLEVWNTGPAIPAAELPNLFERFRRLDPSRGGAEGHSGLGLAIARAIIQAHGGTIAVRSEPGAGTTFTVTLPSPGPG